MYDGLLAPRRSPAAIAAYSFVAFASAAGDVRLAVAATDPVAGVSDSQGSDAGGRCDVQMTQIAEVRAGGVIAAGDPLTASAGGRAVKATKQNGVVVSVWGIAQGDALEGDVFQLLVAPSVIAG